MNSLGSHAMSLRLFPFQILGSYLFLFLFYWPLNYSTFFILTNISDYPMNTIWGL